jgi:hypothetical protein
MLNTAFATYRAVNLKNNALFDFYTDGASSSSINIPPKGFAVGCAAHVSGGPPLAWTGLIEDIEHTTQYGEVLSVASQGILPAQTGRFIQVSPGGGGPSRHAFASYG